MHKQEFNGKSTVTGLKGTGQQAVLPFLKTPGTKVQIKMTIRVGDSCLQVWELIGSYTVAKTNVIFIIRVIPIIASS